jgi:hypothetical protein
MTMKAHHFDAETGVELAPHEIRSNLTGFISWQRLGSVLRAAGELKIEEAIDSFQVDERGLTIRIR